jgi:hypothetical protein
MTFTLSCDCGACSHLDTFKCGEWGSYSFEASTSWIHCVCNSLRGNIWVFLWKLYNMFILGHSCCFQNCSYYLLQTHQPASGVSFGNYSPSLSASGRRSTFRHNSGTATVRDPLGILSSGPSPTKENTHSSSSNPGHKTADWLGISYREVPSPVTVSTSCYFTLPPMGCRV